ncbi:hypothetical protein D3C78_1197560 [compost metagenome]
MTLPRSCCAAVRRPRPTRSSPANRCPRCPPCPASPAMRRGGRCCRRSSRRWSTWCPRPMVPTSTRSSAASARRRGPCMTRSRSSKVAGSPPACARSWLARAPKASSATWTLARRSPWATRPGRSWACSLPAMRMTRNCGPTPIRWPPPISAVPGSRSACAPTARPASSSSRPPSPPIRD